MYAYDEHDAAFVHGRVAEFRDQVARRLDGRLSEDEVKPLRLRNGLYLQLHAYMLRVAIPYGVLSSDQMRALATIAERCDRGYGHFITRQNIQFNRVQLIDVPDMLDALADAGMHAIQTSGNCIRNVTTDAFAGVAGDEEVDPRPTAELLRQWSSLHPEFAHLPRKFTFAVIGADDDRAAMRFHDIGLRAYGTDGRPAYDVWVGGGQGRTPRVARPFEEDVPFERLLPTLDTMLRVYDLAGRRDNKSGPLEPDRARHAFQCGFDAVAIEDAEAERHGRGAWENALRTSVTDLYVAGQGSRLDAPSLWERRHA